MEEYSYFSEERADEHYERLKKESVRTFFSDLGRSMHFVSALIGELPPERFSIERSYDYRREHTDSHRAVVSDNYTLKEFDKNFGKFHRHDEFRILFGGKIIRYRNETNDDNFIRLYENELRDLCEQRLRENRPVQLTNEPLCNCDLSKYESEIVGKSIEIYNADIIRKLQSEYDALKSVDCIVK